LFTNLSLTLDFSSGPAQAFGSSYFTLGPDGLSFNGDTISITTAVTNITLSGNFASTSWTLNDGTTFTASPDFTATITDATGTLSDGDFGIIYASSGSGAPIPEPKTLALLAIGLGGILLSRSMRRGRSKAATSVQYCSLNKHFCGILF
jgi:hypothetical protein